MHQEGQHACRTRAHLSRTCMPLWESYCISTFANSAWKVCCVLSSPGGARSLAAQVTSRGCNEHNLRGILEGVPDHSCLVKYGVASKVQAYIQRHRQRGEAGRLTEGQEVTGVATLRCKLDLAQQLHFDAVVLHLLPWDVGHFDLCGRPGMRTCSDKLWEVLQMSGGGRGKPTSASNVSL